MSVVDPHGNECDWKVRLHLRSLGFPRVPELEALRNAQATFGQYGILIEFASGLSLPDAVDHQRQCLSLQNVDVGSCRMRQGMTTQQSALFGYGARHGVSPNDILCYWVNEVQSDGSALAGCASHPTDMPACVVSAVGSPWTLAHEVGHVLGLRHVKGTDFLMSTPTASIVKNPPEISASDVQTVKDSPLCRRC